MSNHTPHFSPQVRHPSDISPEVRAACDADVAKRAYEKYEARGRAHGFDLEDWTTASRELVAETFGHLSNPSLSPSQHAS